MPSSVSPVTLHPERLELDQDPHPFPDGDVPGAVGVRFVVAWPAGRVEGALVRGVGTAATAWKMVLRE